MARWITITIYGLLLMPISMIELGCRGFPSPDPPIHVNPNMDIQEKAKAYRESDFFENHEDMRMPIPGTVARDQLKDDEHFYFGKIDGKPAMSFPAQVVLDEAFLARGQLIFNRYCAACHAQIGDGNGLVGRRLLVRPTTLHSEYMYGQPPGHFFDVISNGIRTMPKYDMIKVVDRWAGVAYIHALQMSQDIDGAWIKRSAEWWTVK